MKILIGLFAAILIFYLSTLNWRRSVKAVFFLVVIEGALRKWVIPQASDMLYFLKDIVLLGAYFQYFFFTPAPQKFPIRLNWINILIFTAAAWCLFQALNPSLGSPLVGILGLKAYLLYIPLIWLLPSLFQTEEELYTFLRSHLLLTIPVGLIGVVQFFSPINSPINAYAPGAVSNIASFGYEGSRTARITGTFPYLNSYTGYLVACFGLLLPMLSIRQLPRWRWITIIEISLVVVNTLMTGSRTPAIAEAMILAGFLIGRLIAQPQSTLRWVNRFLPPMMVAAIVAMFGFRQVFEAFERRAKSTKDLSQRISGFFLEPMRFSQLKELDGYGTGATHQGTAALRRALDLTPGEKIPVPFESELGRIMLELGPIGFFIWYVLRISIVCTLFSVFLTLKRPFLRQLALSAGMTHLSWLTGFLVFHHTFAVYYWFLTGFIFLLPILERREFWQQHLEIQQQYV